MDLKPECVTAIGQLVDDSKVDSSIFGDIAQASIQAALSTNPPAEQAKLFVETKAYYSALTYLFLEAAKLNLDATELTTVLEEILPNVERAKFLVELYKSNKDKIRNEVLSQITFQVGGASLKDVTWRLDYVIKTSDLARTYAPIYTLKLECYNGETITFACTVEQLQDLYSKLRDATTQIKRTLVK